VGEQHPAWVEHHQPLDPPTASDRHRARPSRATTSLSPPATTPGLRTMSGSEYPPAQVVATPLVIDASARISGGSCSRCQRHSLTPAASASPIVAASRAARIAYAAASRSWAATWATAAACPAASAAYLAAPEVARAAAFEANAASRESLIRTSPRTHARARAIASRGRRSSRRTCSKWGRTCSAQVAAHRASR
jgi:hypothetical protein